MLLLHKFVLVIYQFSILSDHLTVKYYQHQLNHFDTENNNQCRIKHIMMLLIKTIASV